MASIESQTIESEPEKALTSDVLAEQELSLQFPSMGHSEALQLGLTLVNMARETGHAIAIGVDLGEQRVFRAAMPGTCADHDLWLDRKFATVRRFDRCSLELEKRLAETPSYAVDRGLDEAGMALAGGAFPLRVAGSTVGVVGVAGLRSADDHAFVVHTIRRFLKDL